MTRALSEAVAFFAGVGAMALIVGAAVVPVGSYEYGPLVTSTGSAATVVLTGAARALSPFAATAVMAKKCGPAGRFCVEPGHAL